MHFVSHLSMYVYERAWARIAFLPRRKLNPKTQSTQYVLFVQQFAFVPTIFRLHVNGTIRLFFLCFKIILILRLYKSCFKNWRWFHSYECWISFFFGCQQNHLVIWCLDPRPMQMIIIKAREFNISKTIMSFAKERHACICPYLKPIYLLNHLQCVSLKE